MATFLAIVSALGFGVILVSFTVAYHGLRADHPKWGWFRVSCATPFVAAGLVRDTVFAGIGFAAPRAGRQTKKGAKWAGRRGREVRAKRRDRRNPSIDPAHMAPPPPAPGPAGPSARPGRTRRRPTPLLRGVKTRADEQPADAGPAWARGAVALTSAQVAHVNEVSSHDSPNFGATVQFMRQGVQHKIAEAHGWRQVAEVLMVNVGVHPSLVAGIYEYSNELGLLVPKLQGQLFQLVSIYGGLVEEVKSGRMVLPYDARTWMQDGDTPGRYDTPSS